MNEIKVVGQVISSTNYATDKLFVFTPDMLQAAAENFLASGVNELEIPEGVLNPLGQAEDGIDRDTIKQTIAQLPKEAKMIGSYFGGCGDGDYEAFVESKKKAIDALLEFFPDFTYTMLHPAPATDDWAEVAKKMAAAWAELAEYAAGKKKDLQLCLHNHFDSSCETAEQVTAYLDEIEKVNHPNLRWGPDTGHCHGMGDRYLEVFEKYAHLIGNHFHIKARVVAFDQLHGGDLYAENRDIWGNKAEFGRGLYSGFVNCADPEIHTPFKEVFRIIREKAQPTAGVITGAMEIDVPRQHPKLEVMLATMYLGNVHGVKAGMDLSNDQIVANVFGV